MSESVMHTDAVRKRLLWSIYGFEALVITTCLAAGYGLAASSGGSLLAALPLLLIAAAEMTRVSLAGYMVRLHWFGRAIALVTLLFIAIASYEGLVVAFEQFVSLRVLRLVPYQEANKAAKEALENKRGQIQRLGQELSDARHAVEAKADEAAKLLSARQAAPQLSGKTCGRNNVTCKGDRVAVETYRQQTAADNARLASITREKKDAQLSADSLSREYRGLTDAVEKRAYDEAHAALATQVRMSVMHRIAAAWFEIPVDSVTEAQFETVKKYTIFLLAGAFASLSALMSIVAHMQPAEEAKDSRLSRSLRAYLARRRKKVVRIERVEVPVKTTVVKYLPVPVNLDEIEVEKRSGKFGLGKFKPSKPEPIPSSLLGGQHAA